MKKLAPLVLLFIILIPSAHAVPKPVVIKKVDIITATPAAEGLVTTANTLVTFSNSMSPNSNVVLTGYNPQGVLQWTRTIDSGLDEIASAASVDSLGNIWLAGSSAQAPPADSATATIAAENPDNVVIEPTEKIRPDMNQITLWKVSPAGDLVATYSSSQNTPALITGLSVNASGISIIGQMQERPFLLSANLQGVFTKVLFLGTSKTFVNAVVRSADGSVNVFGSSSETLGGKKLAGAVDGILMKVSKTGSITSVVRSSAPKAQRTWLVADAALTLAGTVKTGRNVESAFTKFNSAFVPTWTVRFPSLGNSVVISGAGVAYGAFTSASPIKGLSSWKPQSPAMLVITFDTKGAIAGAFSTPELVAPISLAYSRNLGLYGLAQAADKSVSIFRLSSR